MKHLKMSMMLLLTVAFFTSCEKETTALPENAELKSSAKLELSSYKTMADAIIDGFDLGTYLNSLPKNSLSNKSEVNHRDLSGLEFYLDKEDFFESNCYDLPMEDFNNVNYYSGFPNYLDYYTDNGVYSFGAITPNISFTTTNTNINSQYYGFWPWYDYSVNSYVELATNFNEEDIIINFSGTNVLSAGMKVSSITNGTIMEIKVYGVSGYLGSASQYVEFWGPDYYFGVKSNEPITKIIISDYYNYGLLSIDNVSFGNCDDLDGDGVLNENDPYPNSNMSETISIGGNNLNIDNILTGSGTTMMDQIDALIVEINAQYNGDNYAYLHKQFMTKLSSITYYWRKDRLITRSERSAISSAAWSAEIPYFNDPV